MEMSLILSVTVLHHLVEKCRGRKYLWLKKFAIKNEIFLNFESSFFNVKFTLRNERSQKLIELKKTLKESCNTYTLYQSIKYDSKNNK